MAESRKKYYNQVIVAPHRSAEHRNGRRKPEKSSPSGEEARISFADMWVTVREGKWIILVTCVLIASIVTAYTFIVDPVYQASSIVQVKEPPAQGMGFARDGQLLANEIGVLQNSFELAERVAGRLREKQAATGKRLRILGDPDERPLDDRVVALQLFDDVSFSPVPGQDMISVSVESTSPEEAALIANEYAEEYLGFSRESSRANLIAAREYLEKQVDGSRSEISKMDTLWEQYQRNSDIVSVGPSGEYLLEQMSLLRTQRDAVQVELGQERIALRQIEEELQRVAPGLADRLLEDATGSQRQQQLQAELLAVNTRLAELKVRRDEIYAVNGPTLKGNESRVPGLTDILAQIRSFEDSRDSLNRQLTNEMVKLGAQGLGGTAQAEEVATLQRSVREKQMNLQRLQAQISEFDTRIGAQSARLSQVPQQAIEMEELQRRRGIAAEAYSQSLRDLHTARVAEQSELGNVRLVRLAFVPSRPIRPRVEQNIILGVLLGLGLGVALAFVRRAADHRLRDPQELKDNGYQVIGVIPRMDREIKTKFNGKALVEHNGTQFSTSLMTLLEPYSPIAENFRLVRTNIQFWRSGNPPQTILITSPGQSDGKTVTATNIAVAMAQSGRKTLLVDADMRRPAVGRMLGTASDHGLADLLQADGFFAPEAYATGIPNLYFIPAGKPDMPAAELLGTPALLAFLEQARNQFDTVIVDSPPVLAVTDPLLLAPHCESTIIVVSTDRTDMRALDLTRETLMGVGAHLTGVIYNRFDVRPSNGYGYGRSYYGYTHYEDSSYTGNKSEAAV